MVHCEVGVLAERPVLVEMFLNGLQGDCGFCEDEEHLVCFSCHVFDFLCQLCGRLSWRSVSPRRSLIISTSASDWLYETEPVRWIVGRILGGSCDILLVSNSSFSFFICEVLLHLCVCVHDRCRLSVRR